MPSPDSSFKQTILYRVNKTNIFDAATIVKRKREYRFSVLKAIISMKTLTKLRTRVQTILKILRKEPLPAARTSVTGSTQIKPDSIGSHKIINKEMDNNHLLCMLRSLVKLLAWAPCLLISRLLIPPVPVTLFSVSSSNSPW